MSRHQAAANGTPWQLVSSKGQITEQPRAEMASYRYGSNDTSPPYISKGPNYNGEQHGQIPSRSYGAARTAQNGTSSNPNSWDQRQQQQPSLMNNMAYQDVRQPPAQNITMVEENGQQFETRSGQYGAAATQFQSTEQHSTDETAALRAEVQRLNANAEVEQQALDDMLSQLSAAEDELRDTRARLAAKEAECASLLTRLAQTLSPSHSPWGQQQQQQHHSPSPEIQQRLNDLEVDLRVKDQVLRTRDAELADERAARAQGATELQRAQAKLAAHEKEKDDLAAMLLTAQAGPSPAEASRQSQAAEQLRQQVQFFKTNSERVGRQVRELKGTNQRLSEDLAAKARELADEKSFSLALKMQVGTA